jgi:hypothetical protein
LTIFELRGEWRRLHRMPPPMRLSRDLLTRGISYKLQERAYGGLSTATARKLERASADPLGRGAAKPTQSISLKPGTRLVRRAFLGPCAAMTPISARCPRSAFISCVRCAHRRRHPMKPPPLPAQLEDGQLREPRERLCDIDRRFLHVSERAAFRCGSGERHRRASLM